MAGSRFGELAAFRWGIMIDDVLAGIWALLCVSVLMLVINLMFPGALTL